MFFEQDFNSGGVVDIKNSFLGTYERLYRLFEKLSQWNPESEKFKCCYCTV